MPKPDRTKSQFASVKFPGNPNIDKRWGDLLLNSHAIRCTGYQYAGPDAEFINQPEAYEGTDPISQPLPFSKKYV